MVFGEVMPNVAGMAARIVRGLNVRVDSLELVVDVDLWKTRSGSRV